MASHPVYYYLSQRYGLNLKSVLWEPDVVPDEVQWQELEKILETHHLKNLQQVYSVGEPLSGFW